MSARIGDLLRTPALKVFLLTFDGTFGGRAVVQAFLDTRRDYIKNWISNFESAILIASDRSLTELRDTIRQKFPTGLFMIIELDLMKIDGWMPENIWEFISSPKPTKPTSLPGATKVIDLPANPSGKKQT